MAKFEEASEDVVKLFDEVRDKTTIPQWIEFKVLCNNKLKKDPIKVIKSNELVEVLSAGVNFAVVINEEIFGQLPVDVQKLAIVDKLAGVAVSDSDAVSLETPDFCAHSGVLKKYGYEPLDVLHESVKSLYDKKKQEEDEAKAATKGKRGRKPKTE
jgi:hypothetical protein